MGIFVLFGGKIRCSGDLVAIALIYFTLRPLETEIRQYSNVLRLPKTAFKFTSWS